jgi:hypothetical protein
VEVFRALDLKGVHREIAVFVPRRDEEELAIGQGKQEDDPEKNEQR